MNLIGDPWIPVVFEDGSGRSVGLRELYEKSDTIRDLALTPPQRIAVMRLLLCITQAALDGPEDEDDWRSCAGRIVPKSLSYLEERNERFQLFGKQPFLQVKDLQPKNDTTLDKLDFGLAAGNNPTLFDQQASPEGREHTPAWIILHLLTYQCFSPGGLIGATKWGGNDTGRNSEHAPCIESSPLLTLICGENVAFTIHLNLATKQLLQDEPFGQPIWDQFPDGQKTEMAHEIASSYLGRLIPLSRAVRLQENARTFTLANGISYPKFPLARNSMATVVLRGSGKNERLAYLRINLQKHPWRELGGILSAHHVQNVGGAYALSHLVSNNGKEGHFDLWVGGLVADQAKLIDAAEWTFGIPFSLLGTSRLSIYTNGVDVANRGEQALRGAVKEYCSALKLETGAFNREAAVHYWSILDGHSGQLLELAKGEADLDPWYNSLRNAMRDAYTEVCPHVTPRQIQAWAAGRRKLYLKVPSDNEKEGGES